MTTHAGYVHVRVDAGEARPVDCFVYDAPLVTGQAVSRLLGAAEIGISYEKVQLLDVASIAKNPAVFVEARFVEEDTGTKGSLFVGLVPKVKLPIVCSQEARSPRAVREALRDLGERTTPASEFSVDTLAPAEELLVFELWALFDGDRPVGFRQWRAARDPGGQVSTLEIASLFESHGRRLSTTDVRISERADKDGLFLSDWLELVDGRLHARAALERLSDDDTVSDAPGAAAGPENQSAAFSYRVGGVGTQGPVLTTFGSPRPLRSAYDEYRKLLRAGASAEGSTMVRFLPHMSPTEPVLVARLPTGKDGPDVRLRVGERVYDFNSEAALPVARQELGSTQRAELLLRVPGVDPEDPAVRTSPE